MTDYADAIAFFYAKVDPFQNGEGPEGPVDFLESNQLSSHSLRESRPYK
jgi:hypothetical protein